MKRREFLGVCAAWSSLPFFGGLLGCADPGRGEYWDVDVRFTGKVLVLGAGAAGLAAGYLFARYGIDFEVLEAGPRIGGRVGRLDGFADFPVDLGAEWIHTDPGILARLIDDRRVDGSIDLVPYSPDTTHVFHDGRVRAYNVAGRLYSEYKFKRTTWFDFLESWIAPDVLPHVRLDTPVVSVDRSGPRVVVTDAHGTRHEADRVLVTLPLKVLQGDMVAFEPPLPAAKRRAIDAVTIPPGLKAFFVMRERFYPDLLVMGSPLRWASYDKLFFDGAFRKEADTHLLSFFCVGPHAADYVDLDDETIIERLLAELDDAFDGAASRHLVRAHVQNWSAEPYVQGAYSYDWDGDFRTILQRLRAPVAQQLYWAGEAMSVADTATVHGAMQAAYDAVVDLLETPGPGSEGG